MKFQSLAISCLLGLATQALADTHHLHPKAINVAEKSVPSLKANYAGFCEIEIINQSYDHVRVNGTFDDGTLLEPFTVYSFDVPQYISLFYYGYCHYGMDIFIDSYNGYNVYSAYTRRETTIRIVPYLRSHVTSEAGSASAPAIKAEVSPR